MVQEEIVTINSRKFAIKEGVLDLSNQRIKNILDINDLDKSVGLKQLDLSNNIISKIIGLEKLTHLEILHLSNNSIEEIENLDDLLNLKELDLSGNKIKEIKGLTRLTNLEKLRLGMRIEDLYGNISISLSQNSITEIKGLENLKKLRILNLSGNQIKEIKNLDGQTNLIDIDLFENQIQEIKNLEPLQNLEDLDLGYNKIKEIKNLDSLIHLKSLSLVNNKISLIEGLICLISLKKLVLAGNSIKEIRNLEHLINLEKLSLAENKISEIKGLDNLKNLKELDFDENVITQFQNLEHLSNLQDINLLNNPIIDQEYYLTNKNAVDVVKYCQMKSADILKKQESLKNRKIMLHDLVYNEKMSRCLLAKSIKSKCSLIGEIREIVKKPVLLGFFMYQFPKQIKKIKETTEKNKEKKYQKEIETIKSLIEEINRDPFIHIDDAFDIVGQEIKTCKFCKIARSYDFGVALLTPWNPNVSFEIGLFFSLGKPVFFLNNNSISVPPFDISAHIYTGYSSLVELPVKWENEIVPLVQKLRDEYVSDEHVDTQNGRERQQREVKAIIYKEQGFENSIRKVSKILDNEINMKYEKKNYNFREVIDEIKLIDEVFGSTLTSIHILIVTYGWMEDYIKQIELFKTFFSKLQKEEDSQQIFWFHSFIDVKQYKEGPIHDDYEGFGDAYYFQNQWFEASEQYIKAIKVPGPYHVHLKLAETLFHLQNREDEIQEHLSFVKLKAPEIWNKVMVRLLYSILYLKINKLMDYEEELKDMKTIFENRNKNDKINCRFSKLRQFINDIVPLSYQNIYFNFVSKLEEASK